MASLKEWNNYFPSRIKKNDNGCFIWQRCHADNGYGLALGTGAHRLSWAMVYGPIRKGLCVCHRCDVKDCVNPDHLFLGTQKDNILDKMAKGRQSRGEKHGRAKISDLDVQKIRVLANLGMTQKEIAKQFGLKQPHISEIIRRVARL